MCDVYSMRKTLFQNLDVCVFLSPSPPAVFPPSSHYFLYTITESLNVFETTTILWFHTCTTAIYFCSFTASHSMHIFLIAELEHNSVQSMSVNQYHGKKSPLLSQLHCRNAGPQVSSCVCLSYAGLLSRCLTIGDVDSYSFTDCRDVSTHDV